MNEMNIPKVSICIPTYNQTKYLLLLLQSIRSQNFTDFEIIISDDSGNSGVKDLVDSLDFGSLLKYYKNTHSLGSPENWNAAVKKARGKYVKIMHHDDAFAAEDSLSEMITQAEAGNYDFVFCNTKIADVKRPHRKRVHRIRRLTRLIRKPYLLFFGNSIGAPSTLLLKNELCADLRYNPEYIWLVDIEYYIRLFQQTSSGISIPRSLIITHEAVEQRLTTAILANFSLQIKEETRLYNYLLPQTSGTVRFFMQVRLTRLFFRSKTREKELVKNFNRRMYLLQTYFSVLKFKPAYFAYFIVIRFLDLARKVFYYLT